MLMKESIGCKLFRIYYKNYIYVSKYQINAIYKMLYFMLRYNTFVYFIVKLALVIFIVSLYLIMMIKHNFLECYINKAIHIFNGKKYEKSFRREREKVLSIKRRYFVNFYFYFSFFLISPSNVYYKIMF